MCTFNFEKHWPNPQNLVLDYKLSFFFPTQKHHSSTISGVGFKIDIHSEQ